MSVATAAGGELTTSGGILTAAGMTVSVVLIHTGGETYGSRATIALKHMIRAGGGMPTGAMRLGPAISSRAETTQLGVTPLTLGVATLLVGAPQCGHPAQPMTS